MKFTAILPIKDHSERVPNKNFRLFAGKPLYAWILDTLENVDAIDEIVLNTDSPQLLNLNTKSKKLKIVEREIGVRGDDVSMNNVIESTLDTCKNEHIIQTHTTNPLLTAVTISNSLAMYEQVAIDGYDSLFSVTAHKKRFFFHNKPVNHDPNKLINTQDLEPVLEENSNFYVFSKTNFKAVGNSRLGRNPFYFTIDYIESLDIDTVSDFIVAESVKLKDITNV